MAGKDFLGRGNDAIDDIFHAIGKVVDDVTKLQNVKQPTMPIYPRFTAPNPGDLPDDPVEGQFAIDGETDTAYFYSNGAWHRIGGTEIEWVAFDNSFGTSDPTFPTSNTGPSSNIPLFLTGSSDGRTDDYTSGSGKYTVDTNGNILLPSGIWVSFAHLIVSVTTAVAATAIASFASVSTDSGNVVAIMGPRRSEPDLTSGGFRIYGLNEGTFRYHVYPADPITYRYDGDTSIAANINSSGAASLETVFIKLSSDFFNFVHH